MVLAIDYGKKRIGLAIGDPKMRLAWPFNVIENNQELFEKLEKIITEKDIQEIIIGWPVSLQGKKTEQTKETEKFIKTLRQKISLPIKIVDERLSSQLAQKLSGKSKDDSLEAAVILESYLENK